jgi:plastocyanin
MASTTRVRRPATILLTAVAFLLLSAGLAIAADETVTIQGFAFHPATVTVNVGDTVTWTNSDGVAHTATANNGSFDTEAISPGSSKSVTFNAAGTFGYHCEIHPSMHGTVVVRAAGGGPTQPETSTQPTREDGPGASGFLLLLAAAAGALIAARRLSSTA